MWLDDADVGELPVTWNLLVGHNEAGASLPKAIHFTCGGPWFDTWKDMPGLMPVCRTLAQGERRVLEFAASERRERQTANEVEGRARHHVQLAVLVSSQSHGTLVTLRKGAGNISHIYIHIKMWTHVCPFSLHDAYLHSGIGR